MTQPVPSPGLQRQLDLLEQRFAASIATLPSGAQVALRESGSRGTGPTLVLLHGISSGAASWLHMVVALPEHLHVVAWDAPGYGSSTALAAGSPHADDYAQRLQELLQALGVQRHVLVGHSLGALMACAYAARRPAGLERVVLLSPASGYAGSPAEAERVRRERGEALRGKGVEGLAAGLDQRLLSAGAGEEAREWVHWNGSRLNPAGYLQAVEMLCRSELAAIPAGIPVEVHCGDADVVTKPAACEDAARRLGASFALVDRAGHASPVEQPGAVARLIDAALQPRRVQTTHA